ncbi:MAG: single-stranded DNA-binding protein [Planctomycetota bacterium]|jgi:single-strand DNA-binding protein|nr:MAG: single-stranded DNA-binding protein [Planctomycetota bacterium]
MASYNKVILMGNLTRDVQLKHTASQAVADISIAVNRKFKTKDGQEREEVTYVDCECWGPRAEVIAKFFSKGKPIFIEGRLKLDSWEDKDGQKRSKLKVSIDSFEFVGGSGGGAGGGGEYTREEGSSDSSRSSGGGGGGGGGGSRGGNSSHSGIQEEEIPF